MFGLGSKEQKRGVFFKRLLQRGASALKIEHSLKEKLPVYLGAQLGHGNDDESLKLLKWFGNENDTKNVINKCVF